MGVVLPAHAESGITLFDGHDVASIAYDAHSGVPIRKVAELLSHDLNGLTGLTPSLHAGVTVGQGNGVIIGLASSPAIAELLQKNHIATAPIAGKWETYGRAVIPAPWNPSEKALLIFGSDTRGTIWGVIDLTREMGVSAWQWWADVKIQHVDRIAVDDALKYSRPPSVKYRGIFLNSDGLTQWAKKTFQPKLGGIGPETYARIFELMWRLKANTIWPAMSGQDIPFNAIPENYKVLQDYAIVRGTSHVEMLLRNNTHEWHPQSMGPYNWLTNRQRMIRYWKDAVEQWGQYDNLYTVGLRGADDFPMEGAKTPDAMASVISQAIAAQRRILTDVLHKPADRIPQLFTPYKEVLAAYDTGHMKLPSDITIDWPDDNFGYLMRVPDAEERARSGGSGVYYHLIFWGRPGATLWLASTDPSLMWEEMMKSYHFGSRRFWILNVGSIKPCEFLTQFFLELAFDANRFTNPSSVHDYLYQWVGSNFGKDHQGEITGILWQYYKLAFDRNPEFMAWSTTFPETSPQPTQFNSVAFGDENARRADAYRSIMAQAATLMKEMPASRKAAFYELVQYPVDIAGDLTLQQLDLDKSVTYGYQHRASANLYADLADQEHKSLAAGTEEYDAEENGKWSGIISNHPLDLPMYQALSIPTWKSTSDRRRCGIQVEGGGYFNGRGWWMPTLPLFHRALGDSSYYFDIFTQQPDDATWSVKPNEPWIRIDQNSGKFSPQTKQFEQRIHVSVDWSTAPKDGDGTISVNCSDAMEPMQVHLRVAPPVDTANASFMESQGVVSMYANSADEKIGGWQVLTGLGHTGDDIRTSLDMKPVDIASPAAIAQAPHLVYRFVTAAPDRDYGFPVDIYDETATIRAFALPTFPILPKGAVRIAVSLDGGKPTILNFAAAEFSEQWRQDVLRNDAIAEIIGQRINPGVHVLTVYALDPGVTLDRFEIDFKGALPHYSPIPETKIRKPAA